MPLPSRSLKQRSFELLQLRIAAFREAKHNGDYEKALSLYHSFADELTDGRQLEHMGRELLSIGAVSEARELLIRADNHTTRPVLLFLLAELAESDDEAVRYASRALAVLRRSDAERPELVRRLFQLLSHRHSTLSVADSFHDAARDGSTHHFSRLPEALAALVIERAYRRRYYRHCDALRLFAIHRLRRHLPALLRVYRVRKRYQRLAYGMLLRDRLRKRCASRVIIAWIENATARRKMEAASNLISMYRGIIIARLKLRLLKWQRQRERAEYADGSTQRSASGAVSKVKDQTINSQEALRLLRHANISAFRMTLDRFSRNATLGLLVEHPTLAVELAHKVLRGGRLKADSDALTFFGDLIPNLTSPHKDALRSILLLCDPDFELSS